MTYSTGTMAKINPLKYRGYYHDAESGFYYLQSRYYDPAIGRFINADGQISPGWVLPEYEPVCVLWE
ncbi:MAG: RHS repeat-associated core domain-containing protein [Oscillospiraceae bacterium]